MSAIDTWVRLRRFKSRIVARIDFSAEALTPGRKLQNTEASCEFFARPGAEAVAKEVKLDVRITPLPPAVLTVDNPGFGGVHLKPAFHQTGL
jgi:hypothetical protein